IVEVAVLVFERQVAIEPERSQVSEILDLVGGIDSRRHRRERRHEQTDEKNPLRARWRRTRQEPSTMNFATCARLNPACPIIAGSTVRRRRKIAPQNAPSTAVASATSCPCSRCPSPNSALKMINPGIPPPRYCSNRRSTK